MNVAVPGDGHATGGMSGCSPQLPSPNSLLYPGWPFRYKRRLMTNLLSTWYKALIAWYISALKTGGYAVVALMMAAESSVLPLPSEVVIPPAAHWAHTGQIDISIAGIIIAGTIGSWFGATIMYWAARWGGRPLLLKYGRYA